LVKRRQSRLQAFVALAEAEFGQVNVLINNAVG
jgi:NAD(P)-dependent dehydrogenase (short-subunit alcohol dehydrogenase family)